MSNTILKKRVQFSTVSIVMSIVTMAFLIFICCYQFNKTGLEVWPWLLLGLVTIWGFCTLYYTPMYITLTDDTITVQTPIREKKIPLEKIAEVKICTPTMAERRICGSGGYFGYWGWFREATIGKYFAYYGKSSETFLIRLKSGRQYMLGCRDSKEMAKALADQLKSQIKAPLPPKGGDSKPPLGGKGASSAFHFNWHQPLPEDEIHRQQQMKERLKPGLQVELRGLGRFIYNGTWDTMHSFYPAEGQDLQSLIDKASPTRARLRRDPAGRLFLQLPYTLLADEVIIP